MAMRPTFCPRFIGTAAQPRVFNSKHCALTCFQAGQRPSLQGTLHGKVGTSKSCKLASGRSSNLRCLSTKAAAHCSNNAG